MNLPKTEEELRIMLSEANDTGGIAALLSLALTLKVSKHSPDINTKEEFIWLCEESARIINQKMADAILLETKNLDGIDLMSHRLNRDVEKYLYKKAKEN